MIDGHEARLFLEKVVEVAVPFVLECGFIQGQSDLALNVVSIDGG